MGLNAMADFVSCSQLNLSSIDSTIMPAFASTAPLRVSNLSKIKGEIGDRGGGDRMKEKDLARNAKISGRQSSRHLFYCI